ncbi:MAG: class I SAM-dependent methyltransferase [Pseudomonadota bacterium]
MNSNIARDDLIEAIHGCGSDDAEFFGYPVDPDGLYLQQDPQEYADFVGFMANECPPSQLSIEIGIASGGQTKFLRDYYSVNKTIVVDIGQHPNHHHWPRIKPLVKTEFVAEIIDDSHSSRVREQLMPWARQIDFAFVDGDHSYRGLKKDMFLMKELLQPNAICALHDTTAVPDCAKVFEEMKRSDDFELLRNFDNRFGISVWRYTGTGKSNVNAINRWFGMGAL